MNIVADLIEAFDPENPNFRPTEIYNEGWLLKALLYQFSDLEPSSFPLSFLPGASWYSEALLPTAFKPRYRGDPLAESRTNADGVIGHIMIGEKAKADLELTPDADQFVVVEAKIGSRLSSGTTNSPYFDQAARNVACMAEVLRQADRHSSEVNRLAFIVLASQAAIDGAKFSNEMELGSIKKKIQDRVAGYSGELDSWHRRWLEPTLEVINIHTISWEDSIDALRSEKEEAAESLLDFYDLCLEYNL